MKFGTFFVDDAIGAILAHSIQTPNGRMRKGILITQDDVAALKSAGIESLTAAKLEQGDVHENEAAQQFAQAICPDPGAVGLSLTAPFTGRVNIIADGPGIVQLDAARLIKANSVDPMITVATVPEFQQMTTGGLVATIKIISYGVHQSKLDQACELGQSSIHMSAPKLSSADLIISNTAGGAGDKGKDAIAARLEALGVTLGHVVMVPHDAHSMSAAIKLSKADLIMILSGTATSDWADTAPNAVAQAGGHVRRFGMPVDPGNLLFLGEVGSRPVIGLPGCARSPALNGADWVLSRVVCGCDVTDADFAQMAIGGLLKEIPTRPQPRRAKSRTK